jgi:tRNA(Arg) A34 adenosine deaminase TadA
MESLLRLETVGLNHRIDVISGVREKECGELMRNFFRTRRE